MGENICILSMSNASKSVHKFVPHFISISQVWLLMTWMPDFVFFSGRKRVKRKIHICCPYGWNLSVLFLQSDEHHDTQDCHVQHGHWRGSQWRHQRGRGGAQPQQVGGHDQGRVATKIFKDFWRGLYKDSITSREPFSIILYTRPTGSIFKQPIPNKEATLCICSDWWLATSIV